MTPENFQLTNHNPLRALDEQRLVSMLEAGERGQYAELQWLYRFVEKRDPIGRAVKSRLLSSIGKLEWSIKVPDCGDDEGKQAMAEAQQKTLRAEYDRIGNLHDALKFLALAELRGFAHLEKIYAGGTAKTPGRQEEATDMPQETPQPASSSLASLRLGGEIDPWDIVELRIVEQWFWVRRGIYGAWEYNDGAKMGATSGAPVDPARFIIREVDGAIGEIMAKLYVRKDNNDADWDGAIETFGVPPVVIEMPPNIAEGKEAEFKQQAENVASGAKGVIPSGAKVHTINPLSGAGVFKERLEYLETQLVIAATGGKLTILTESGSGTLAGEAQADAFAEIAETIAVNISGALNDQLDREILARKHKGEPPLAYFDLAPANEKDGSKALGDAKLAKDAGYALDPDDLRERSGYKLTAIGAPTNSNQHETGAPSAASNGDAKAAAQMGSPLPATPGLPPDASQTVAKPTAIPASPSAPQGESAQAAPVTPAELQRATASALGVTPEYLAPAAQEFGTLLAEAGDGSLTPDALLASAQAVLDSLPELAAKMDTTGMADKLTQAMRGVVATTLKGGA